MVSQGNSDTYNDSNLAATLPSSNTGRPFDPQVIENRDIVVIGSGCTGLAAAWHLNRSGIDVQLFEADERAGGHANTVNGVNILT